ncbi:MAG TPA: 2-dehydropantoate 2-reductase [Candidatus Borkfalkia faecipullorum]|uniref:2-dehydropantoate 2-reductase n=1 Tax=Candidatus Borkfalkia faecipullorum TaxID=2838510 RepID=A0A9D2AFJ5_9FIRM|nr:2-dehydropantoate 2-reductase [Candidatus Borkfalkia faecipullorum]
MNCAIYGAGAMGTVLGAYIARAGRDVDLINRNREHVAALKEKGAHIVGTVDFTQKVNALLPEEMTKKYDIILLMTKQRMNGEIVAFLKDYLKEDGALCTCQNGLPEPKIAEIIGQDRTLGCAIAWGATFRGKGVSELTSDPAALTFSLGAYGKGNHLQDVKELLECMGQVTVEQNFIGARWSKLLINSAFSGLSTVTGATFGEISVQKSSRRVAQAIMKECIDVAKAAGIRIEPVQGHKIDKLFDYKGKLKKALSFALIPVAMKKHARLISSMLQDLRAGKKCEIDFINGVVCEFGKKYGVPTPCNDKTVQLVHEIEEGKRPISFENISAYCVK